MGITRTFTLPLHPSNELQQGAETDITGCLVASRCLPPGSSLAKVLLPAILQPEVGEHWLGRIPTRPSFEEESSVPKEPRRFRSRSRPGSRSHQSESS